MCKMKFMLDGIVEHPYGSSFIVRDGQLVKASSYDLDGCSAEQGFSQWCLILIRAVERLIFLIALIA